VVGVNFNIRKFEAMVGAEDGSRVYRLENVIEQALSSIINGNNSSSSLQAAHPSLTSSSATSANNLDSLYADLAHSFTRPSEEQLLDSTLTTINAQTQQDYAFISHTRPLILFTQSLGL
jgi:hypothetical protein